MSDKDENGAFIGSNDPAPPTRQIQEALRESEQEFRAILNSIGAATIVTDAKFEITSVNDVLRQWNRDFGLPTEIVGKSLFDVFPFLTEAIRKEYLEVINTGRVSVSEESYVVNGREITAETRRIPISDGGKIVKVITVLHDITQQKQTIDALKKSQQLNQAIIDSFPLGFSVRSRTGQLLMASKTWKTIWGLSEAQVENYMQTRKELVFDEHDNYLGKYATDVQRIYRVGGLLFIPELRFVRKKDGKETWISQYYFALHDENGAVERVVILTDDITERKQAEKVQQVLLTISQATSSSRNLEELLHIIRQQLSTLIDTTNFFVALYDPQNDLYQFPFFVDQADQNEFSIPQPNKGLTDYVRRTGTSLLVDEGLHAQLIQKGEIEQIGSPSRVWLGAPLKTAQGVIGVVAVQSYTDSTLYSEKDLELLTFVSENVAMAIARKHTEDELHESERRFRDILETIDTIALLLDKEGNLTFCNDYLLDLTGYSREEVIGKSWFQTFLPDDVREEVISIFKAIGSTGSIPSYYENYIITKSGERRLIFWNNTILHNLQGVAVGVARIGFDITERKQAEEALKQSEARNLALLNAIPDLMFLNDRNGVFIDYHTSDPSLLFAPPEQFLGKNLSEVLPRELARKISRSHLKAINTGQLQLLEYTLPLMGEIHQYEARIVACDHDKVLTIVRDITERKQAEDSLMASEKRYRDLVELSPNGIVIHQDGKVVFANSSALKLAGCKKREQLLGKSIFDFVHPDYREKVAERVGAMLSKTIDVPLLEEKFVKVDGTAYEVEVVAIATSYNAKPAVQVEFREITERKLAEESLIASEKRYRDLVELSPNGILIHQDGKVVFANRSALRLFGYHKLSELLGKSVLDFVHPDYRQVVTDRIKTMLSKKTSAPLMEERLIRADGTPYDVEVVAIATNYNAKPAIQVEFRDISERKRADEERLIHQRELEVLYSFNEALASTLDIKTILKQSLQLTLKATGLSSAGIYMLDKEGFLQMVISQGFSRELQTFAKRLEKGTLYTWKAIDQNAIQEVSIDEYPESDFKNVLLKEGLKLLVCIPLTSKGRPLGVMNLISKKVKVLAPWERDLLQSFGHQISIALQNALYFESVSEHSQALEKMLKERSQFFSMASHELRTPITVINGYLDIINRNIENMGKTQSKEVFRKLSDHSQRLCLLVETLLNISRMESPVFTITKKPCNIGPIVERTIYLCEQEAKNKNIIVHTRKFVAAGKSLRIIGDPIAIENVLVNILGNAIKYSHTGGEISITWSIRGNALQLNCSDKGIGLPPGEKEKIFDEFYRVERGGELKKSGTGLGLSIARRLVERMGGKIWARSRGLNKGITISFTLPLAPSAKPSKAKRER
jgi:PAS domain S-box-containing protein